MAASPRSVTSSFRPPGERPVVSGLGISSGSEGSDAQGPAAAELDAPAPGDGQAPWERPPPSKKELWRMRRNPVGPTVRSPTARPASPPVVVAPEMRDKCFKCLEKGHYKKECTNQIVCFRCGLPGHGSRDCKRPRSPSSVDDLRREAVAKVARRSSPPPRLAPVSAPQGVSLSVQNVAPGVDVEWPPLAPPRLQVESRVEEAPAELCVVKRSAVVSDLERRLQFAMVAYVAGQRRVLAPARVKEILAGKLDIAPELVSVHCYRPEDFLVVFTTAEMQNRVMTCPSVEFEGDRLIFRPWNRQSQAVHSVFGFKVWLVIEGIPPHAWDRSVVEELLGSSCKVEEVAPETASRSDLSSFKLTAWTASPDEIPALRWLAVPEPGLEAPPALLQYKVLIHTDMIMDLREAGEPWFFGSSSGSGQSGLPDDDDIAGGGPRSRRLVWQFGVPDTRSGGLGGVAAGGGGGAWSRPSGHDWRLPPMEATPVATPGAPPIPILCRLTRRVSAFQRLTGQSRREDSNRAPTVDAARGEVMTTSNRSGGTVPEATANPPPRLLRRAESEQRKEGEGTCPSVVQSGTLRVGLQVAAPMQQTGPVLVLAATKDGNQEPQGGVATGQSVTAKMSAEPAVVVPPVASEKVGPGSQGGGEIGPPDVTNPVAPREEPTRALASAPPVFMQDTAAHEAVVETQTQGTPGNTPWMNACNRWMASG
ncbi:hypothetical protein VPH35_007947 [Triticum aestivum]